jgi:DNA-binding MarR family transcriptional regulator
LRRLPDSRDGRRTLVVLTKRDRELAADGNGTIEAVVDGALEKMSRREVTAARAAFSRLAAALEAEQEADHASTKKAASPRPSASRK